MIPKFDIDKKIAEQKADLISRLTTEIKLPITDIQKFSFENNKFIGQFSVTIDRNKKQLVAFEYKNGFFSLDMTSLKTDLESKWGKVFSDNEETIKVKIQTDLHIKTDNADRISFGQKNIVYIYESGSPIPISINVEYDNNEWTVRKI